MVGGDPTILNDCGNRLMTASIDLDGGRTSMAEHQSMPANAADRAAEGSGLETAYGEAVAAVVRAASNLQSTLAEDGYYLQRGSQAIDTVMNHHTPGSGSDLPRVPGAPELPPRNRPGIPEPPSPI